MMTTLKNSFYLLGLLLLPQLSVAGQTVDLPENAPAPVENVDGQFQPPTITRIRALDKITARITELDLPQDQAVEFGTLVIKARTCRSRPPEETPETFAFLEIDDRARSGGRSDANSDGGVRVFTGWMMASSPALNAMEHPVYDVWVIACTTNSPVQGEGNE